MLRRQTAAASVALCLLLPAPSALASGSDVILDCNNNGRLSKKYTQKEYRQALAQMPADIKQYTDCEGIIRRAQLGLANSTGGQASGNNPYAGATPTEAATVQKDIATATRAGRTPQRVGGAVVTPGTLSFRQISAISKLPTPLVVLVVLMLVGTVLGAAHLFRSRRERPGDPGA
ncbi:MAG: hypothetical protein QOG68_2169 [Solirubrobacteraceae bacterium]|jgi:hypothetical protein|nr:hypothetical protein [Solirubrobacteraceae bacterium]